MLTSLSCLCRNQAMTQKPPYNLFGNRILHRDSAVQEVILDQKEDINRYAACEIDERPQVANQIRRPLFALPESLSMRLMVFSMVFPGTPPSAMVYSDAKHEARDVPAASAEQR